MFFPSLSQNLHQKKDNYLTEATIYRPCEVGIAPALQGFFNALNQLLGRSTEELFPEEVAV